MGQNSRLKAARAATTKSLKTQIIDFHGMEVEITEAEGKYLKGRPEKTWGFELAWIRCVHKNDWQMDMPTKLIFAEGWNSAVFLGAKEFMSLDKPQQKQIILPPGGVIRRPH